MELPVAPAPPVVAAAQEERRLQIGRAIAWLRRTLSVPWVWEARWRGAELLGPVEFMGRPIITMAPRSRLIFGGGNVLASSTRCNPLGNFQPCVLRTMATGAHLELGREVGLSSASLCAALSIVVGEGTLIGAGAVLLDNDFHLPIGELGWSHHAVATARPIRIGRGCFIGARAFVLKGVTMGDRAVVGAGAVVTRDVPAGMMAVGNPARIVPRPASPL